MENWQAQKASSIRAHHDRRGISPLLLDVNMLLLFDLLELSALFYNRHPPNGWFLVIYKIP